MNQRLVALLRGVNVGGKVLSMPDLKVLAETLGYRDVGTYIQSGNLVISSDKRPDSIQKALESGIQARFGMDVVVIVRTAEELRQVLVTNPFCERANDPRRLHVTFLADSPDPDRVSTLPAAEFLPDEFAVIGREVYLFCPHGYGRSKLGNAFWERKLKMSGTTRNWKTVQKLNALLDAADAST